MADLKIGYYKSWQTKADLNLYERHFSHFSVFSVDNKGN
jgi:hypothetical protein